MEASKKEQILKEIDDSFEDHVALLQGLIRIPSVNPWFKDNPEFYGEKRVQEHFKEIFVEMGAD